MCRVRNSSRELPFRVGRPETSQGATIYPLALIAPGIRRLCAATRLRHVKKARRPLVFIVQLEEEPAPIEKAKRSGDVRRTGLILAGQPPKHGEGPLDVSPHRSLRGLCVAFEDRRQDEFMVRVAQR
jgi:hypothetical protein